MNFRDRDGCVLLNQENVLCFSKGDIVVMLDAKGWRDLPDIWA